MNPRSGAQVQDLLWDSEQDQKREQMKDVSVLTREITRLSKSHENLVAEIEEIRKLVQEDIRPLLGTKRKFSDTESAREKALKNLKCDFLGCPQPCTIAVAWSNCFLDGPGASSSAKWGSPLGLHIVQLLNDPESSVLDFYPDKDHVFCYIFVSLLTERFKDLENGEHDEHVEKLFERNSLQIFRDIFKRLRTTRATRKHELICSFLGNDGKGDINIGKLFEDADAVNNGKYRQHGSSPIDLPRFVRAVRKTFRLTGNCPKVSIAQLAFCCVYLIREFTSSTLKPALYLKVTSLFAGRIPYDEQLELIRVMGASLRKRLSESAEETAKGWKTAQFEVVDGDRWDDSAKLFIQDDYEMVKDLLV